MFTCHAFIQKKKPLPRTKKGFFIMAFVNSAFDSFHRIPDASFSIGLDRFHRRSSRIKDSTIAYKKKRKNKKKKLTDIGFGFSASLSLGFRKLDTRI